MDFTFIRRLLYDLKKQYGFPVDLYVQTLASSNVTTGSKTINRVKYHLPKVCILPVKFVEQALYSPGFLKAAHRFTYGEYQNYEVKDFLIDGNDLPTNFEIKSDHYFIRDHKKYEIADIKRLEGNHGYICTVKRLTGTEVDEIHEDNIIQYIRFTHNVVVVKN